MSDFETMKQHCSDVHVEVERRLLSVERDLRGNGRPGLCNQMTEVQTQLLTLNKTVEGIDPRLRQLERIGSIAVGALGVLQVLLKVL